MNSYVERLMNLQEILNIPSSQMASLLGVNESTVRRWRSGKTNPSPVCCDRIHVMIKVAPDVIQKVCAKESE